LPDPVAVIDYGMGNLRSVVKALSAVGADARIVTTPAEVSRAPVLVLPGVGAFPDAMRELARSGVASAVTEAGRAGRPLLGICLGLQLLFDESQEKGTSRGLGLLPGRVVRFEDRPGVKVPHIGWNQIRPERDASGRAHPILDGVADGAWVYFVHSYFPLPDDPATVLATSDHGAPFPCIVGQGATIGIQFHPEKSQKVGLRLLANFLALAGAHAAAKPPRSRPDGTAAKPPRPRTARRRPQRRGDRA
jgi:glutamine amidotransferase